MEKNFLGVKKGAWTKEEDILLKNCIDKFGEGKWHKVPLRAGLNRCRKSCRLRWLNYLRPNIKKGYFTKDEVDLIIRLHKLLGNRWSLIAGRIPGRTANDVKNFWNTRILKKSLSSLSAAGKYKKTTAEIKKNILYKPRPRTFSKSHIVSSEEVENKEEENGGQNKPSSFASILSQDSTVDLFPSINNVEVPFLLSDEEVDECIRWLLETETEADESFCPTQINQKVTELGNLAIDAALGPHQL